MQYEPGMMARSLAGHDQGQNYVILREEGAYVYLVDGRIRTVDRPKKKKKKHIQLMSSIPQELADKLERGAAIRNEDIKRVIGGIAHVESRCN